LLQQLYTVDGGFLYGRCERLFATELKNAYLPDKYFKRVF